MRLPQGPISNPSGSHVSATFKIYPKSNHTSISTVRSTQVTTISLEALQQLSNWSPGSHSYTKLAKQQSVIFQKYKSHYTLPVQNLSMWFQTYNKIQAKCLQALPDRVITYLSDIFYFSLLTLAPATLVFFLFLGHTHNLILLLSFCTFSSLYQQALPTDAQAALPQAVLSWLSDLVLPDSLCSPNLLFSRPYFIFLHSIWHCLPIYNLTSYQECKLHEIKDLFLLLVLFIYLLLAALGLQCWAGFSVVAAKEGFSLPSHCRWWLPLSCSTGSVVFGFQ